MFLVYLFATLTFAKSSPLFDFGPRDDANSDVMKVRTKDPKDINLWIKRTDKFLEGKNVWIVAAPVHVHGGSLPLLRP